MGYYGFINAIMQEQLEHEARAEFHTLLSLALVQRARLGRAGSELRRVIAVISEASCFA